MKAVRTVLSPPCTGLCFYRGSSQAVHAQTGPRPAWRTVLPDRRLSSAPAHPTPAPTSRPAGSAVREVRKHLLVRIRRRHSAGQVTLAAPFVVIFMRWAAPHGWAVGKITNQITAATPRLFKNFNFRCTWTDGWTNNMLKLDEYQGGPTAIYGSSLQRHLKLTWRSDPQLETVL